MAVVIALGFVPESAPVQISQVAINFIMSMQYNTFRQAQGEPVATTFVTNHVRQVGVGIAKAIKHIGKDGDKSYLRKFRVHLFMLLCFIAGAVVGTLFCKLILGRAIWITLAPPRGGVRRAAVCGPRHGKGHERQKAERALRSCSSFRIIFVPAVVKNGVRCKKTEQNRLRRKYCGGAFAYSFFSIRSL